MSQNPSTLQSFFAELKRRRVFRVMAVYGATAFVLLQVADLLAEGMGLSEQVLRITTFVVLIGFPIAIVLAWAFETTPEGVKRTADAAPAEISEILAQPASKSWPSGLLALAGMALLFGGGWWMGNRGAENPANILVSEVQAAGFKAIAALPFENVNGDDENRLIAVGIHDDLVTQMQRIASLHVTGRTSVREYENTEKTFEQIAGELGVDYLLDGSVRRSGSQVRVNVALLDAASGEQLWTRQYDVDVTPENLFDVQSQIARQVVAELEAQLTPEEEEALESQQAAANPVAQQWYYRGIDAWNRVSDTDTEALDAMRRAVEVDSGFVAAWAYLARFASRSAFIGDSDLDEARTATERTEALAPGSVEAHYARGFFEYYGRRDFDAALNAFRAAEVLAPSDGDIAYALALVLRRQGDWGASTASAKRAVQLDPRNIENLGVLAENLMFMGAYKDADIVLDRALSVAPANEGARSHKVENLVNLDRDPRRALRLAAELGLDPSEFWEGRVLLRLAQFDRDLAQALAVANQAGRDIPAPLATALLLWKAETLRFLEDPAALAVADSALALAATVRYDDVQAATMRGYAHAIAGRSEEAMRDLRAGDRLVRTWEDHVDPTRDAGWIVGAYGLLGETDRGLDLLEELIDRPATDLSVATLTLHPRFDPYRDDPRFDELVRRREAFEAEGALKGEAGWPWLP